jgi:hypothetical protein
MSQRTTEPPAKRVQRNGIPVLIDHPRAGEALAMVVEWVNDTITRERAHGEERGGGQSSYIEMIRQLALKERDGGHREKRKSAKTYIDKAGRRVIDIPKAYTAHGVQSRGGVKPSEGSDAPLSRPRSPSVIETQLIMDALQATNVDTYFAVWQWAARKPIERIAKEIGCGKERVYGHLLAATVFITSHIDCGTWSQADA